MQKSFNSLCASRHELVGIIVVLGCVLGLSWWISTSWRSSYLIFCLLFLVACAAIVHYQKTITYTATLSYSLMLWQHPEIQQQIKLPGLLLEPFLLLCTVILDSDLLEWQQRCFATLEQQYGISEQALQETQSRYHFSSLLRLLSVALQQDSLTVQMRLY